MVSIESKSKYLEQLSANEKLFAFYKFLNLHPITFSNSGLHEIDEIYFNLIKGIQENNQSDFISFYNKLSSRNVTKESNAPFVHNDLLIFVIVAPAGQAISLSLSRMHPNLQAALKSGNKWARAFALCHLLH